MGPLERGKGRFTIHCIPIVLHEIFTIDKSYNQENAIMLFVWLKGIAIALLAASLSKQHFGYTSLKHFSATTWLSHIDML